MRALQARALHDHLRCIKRKMLVDRRPSGADLRIDRGFIELTKTVERTADKFFRWMLHEFAAPRDRMAGLALVPIQDKRLAIRAPSRCPIVFIAQRLPFW